MCLSKSGKIERTFFERFRTERTGPCAFISILLDLQVSSFSRTRWPSCVALSNISLDRNTFCAPPQFYFWDIPVLTDLTVPFPAHLALEICVLCCSHVSRLWVFSLVRRGQKKQFQTFDLSMEYPSGFLTTFHQQHISSHSLDL